MISSIVFAAVQHQQKYDGMTVSNEKKTHGIWMNEVHKRNPRIFIVGRNFNAQSEAEDTNLNGRVVRRSHIWVWHHRRVDIATAEVQFTCRINCRTFLGVIHLRSWYGYSFQYRALQTGESVVKSVWSAFKSMMRKRSRYGRRGDSMKIAELACLVNSPEGTFGLAIMPESSQGEIVDVDPDVSSPIRRVPGFIFHLVEGI